MKTHDKVLAGLLLLSFIIGAAAIGAFVNMTGGW